jgi:hypothetical protein
MSVVFEENHRYEQRVGAGYLRRVSTFWGLWAAVVLAATLRAQSASEYEIKAAFLYKFASFIQWPSSGDTAPAADMAAASTPICIGILGTDGFGQSLDQVVRGKQAGGRKFAIQHFHVAGEALHCEIVFISGSEQNRIREILRVFGGKPVLTVSEVPGFCESGGIINLRKIDDAIRFEINPASGERAGLRFSSKLLSLARLLSMSRLVPGVSP